MVGLVLRKVSLPFKKKIREPNEQGNDNKKKIVRHLVLYATFTRQKRKEEKEQK